MKIYVPVKINNRKRSFYFHQFKFNHFGVWIPYKNYMLCFNTEDCFNLSTSPYQFEKDFLLVKNPIVEKVIL